MIITPAKSAGRSQLATKVVPAPQRWNARDGLSAMKPGDAIRLDNWIVRPGRLELRPGSIRHATGLSGAVQTLATYGRRNRNQQIIAATPTSLYRVSALPPATLAPTAEVTSLGSGYWQTGEITNPGGDFLLMVNGVDAMRCFDGTAWSTPTVTSAIATRSIASTAFVDVAVHVQRVFLVEKSSLRIWYLEPGAIGGTAWPIDLAPICRQGGEIQAIASLTTDGGRNSNDKLVAVTTQGEMVVYSGVHPGTAGTWQLAGVFDVPVPLGRRCFLQYGGSLAYLSRDGLLPVADVLGAAAAKKPVEALSEPIRYAYQSAAVLGTGSPQWGMVASSHYRMSLINVPTMLGSVQFALSEDGGWSALSGWNALCWAGTGTDTYFGTADGRVMRLGGSRDDGSPITALSVEAYSKFGTIGRKVFKRVRPVFDRAASLKCRFGTLVNYRPVPGTLQEPLDARGALLTMDGGGALLTESGGGALLVDGAGETSIPAHLSYADRWRGSAWSWDEIDWPLTPATWTRDERGSTDHWRGLSGHGHSAALMMAVTAMEPVAYEGCEIGFEAGGQV